MSLDDGGFCGGGQIWVRILEIKIRRRERGVIADAQRRPPAAKAGRICGVIRHE
jgi:hypothetical protein